MGKVELAESNELRVTLNSPTDAAALRTALRLVPDPDAVDLSKSPVLLDANHVDNILAVCACGFEWSPEAMSRPIDELAPYAQQSSSIHASSSLKSHRRMMRKMEQERGE